MSDTAQGSGWWQASDGKWYPPESHPSYQSMPSPPPPPPPPGSGPVLTQQAPAMVAPSYVQYSAPAPTSPARPKKPWWRRWWAIGIGVLIAVVVIVNIASPQEDDQADGATVAPSDAVDDEAAPTEPAVDDPAAASAPTAPPSNLTPSQQSAVRSAESYLSFKAFSRQGLIDQLSSEYGDQFPVEDATVAVDSLNVDWLEQAMESAQSYLEFSGFSRQGLIDQLSSEFGEQFTIEQATFGVDYSSADWNAEAAESARSYLDVSGFSCQGLICLLYTSDAADDRPRV